MENKALVVIDIQNDITKNYKEIIEQVNQAIDWAVKNKMKVVYIRHENLSPGTRTFKTNTKGAEWVPELKIVSEDVFTKYKSNALTCEDFVAFIRDHQLTDFYITGADAAVCVKSTVFNLRKANFEVCVLKDCITSYDKKKMDELLTYYESKGCRLMTLSDL